MMILIMELLYMNELIMFSKEGFNYSKPPNYYKQLHLHNGQFWQNSCYYNCTRGFFTVGFKIYNHSCVCVFLCPGRKHVLVNLQKP